MEINGRNSGNTGLNGCNINGHDKNSIESLLRYNPPRTPELDPSERAQLTRLINIAEEFSTVTGVKASVDAHKHSTKTPGKTFIFTVEDSREKQEQETGSTLKIEFKVALESVAVLYDKSFKGQPSDSFEIYERNGVDLVQLGVVRANDKRFELTGAVAKGEYSLPYLDPGKDRLATLKVHSSDDFIRTVRDAMKEEFCRITQIQNAQNFIDAKTDAQESRKTPTAALS